MPRAKQEVTRINLYVPDKILTAYRALAKKRETSLSALAREGLRQYIKQELTLEHAKK